MEKEGYTVLRWLEETHTQETPLLFIGERVRNVKLQEGMTLYRIDHGDKYRLDGMSFKDERDERNNVKQLILTPIDKNDNEGKQKVGNNVNSWLAVWLADISEEQQELFYAEQKVKGNFNEGKFIPTPEYLVDWYGMFMKYFDILRSHPYSGQTSVDRNMPWLVRKCIEELGVGVFNELIREHFVGKEMTDELFQQVWHDVYKYDWFTNIDRKLSFPSRVLESTMNMGTHFDDAVKTVVFKDGIKIDISKLI
jgi:hypothetical protein